MKVEIKSRKGVLKFLESSEERWDVVSVRDSLNLSLDLGDNAKDVLVLGFSDTVDENGLFAPSHDDVRSAIEFSKNRERVVFHCLEGVSRSAALAYVVACADSGSPDEALSCLNFDLHWPNLLIVGIGAEILGDSRVLSVLKSKMEEYL